MAEIAIRALISSDMEEAADLLTYLNPDVPAAVLAARLGDMLADHSHYCVYGAFDGDTLAGLAGAWIATKIWCGRYLEIDNLVVTPDVRGSGVGSMLIRHLEALAVSHDCKIVVLDSYTANHPSHRLYHRLGFEIWGFHFVKPIGDWKGGDSH
jgi:ribosomal protein S18 acetylase RimI-like enzyme